MRVAFYSLLLVLSSLSACSPNNVTEDASLRKHFDAKQVSGTFGLFDNGQGHFTVFDIGRFSDSTYLPASTYKIVNSLIGLETGVVRDENSTMPWDSVSRGRSECEKELKMLDAFKLSCVPWYQQLARQIGASSMQHYLDTLGYGSKNGRFRINENLDMFWLNNSVKVTADEQLGLVKKLYFHQLPFQKRTQEIVQKMMLMEDNANYKLSYKTGWGHNEQGHSIGWVIGWVEENQHPYFFALQLESPDPKFDIASARLEILHNCLRQLGYLEGKK